MRMVSFVFVLVFVLVIYALVRIYPVFGRFGMPVPVYIILELLFTVIMIVSAMSLGKIENTAVRLIFQLIGSIQFIILIYSALIFAVRDIVMLLVKLIGQISGSPDGGRLRSFCNGIKSPYFGMTVLILLLLVGVFGFINIGIIREKNYEINIDKKAEIPCLTVAVVSDLHLGTGIRSNDLQKMADSINNADCDTVLIVGDISDNNTPDGIYDEFAEKMAGIKSRYGVYFSYGNHDGSGHGKLEAALDKAGIKILADEETEFAGIHLIGRKDSYGKNMKNPEDYGIPENEPVIMMNHRPSGLAGLEAADIVLSGHTHGEQFPLCYLINMFDNDNNYGIKKFGSMTSIVTSGIGGWGFRFKFPSNSEIVKLKINFKMNSGG